MDGSGLLKQDLRQVQGNILDIRFISNPSYNNDVTFNLLILSESMNQVKIGGGLLPELLHSILYWRPSNILQVSVSTFTLLGPTEIQKIMYDNKK